MLDFVRTETEVDMQEQPLSAEVLKSTLNAELIRWLANTHFKDFDVMMVDVYPNTAVYGLNGQLFGIEKHIYKPEAPSDLYVKENVDESGNSGLYLPEKPTPEMNKAFMDFAKHIKSKEEPLVILDRISFVKSYTDPSKFTHVEFYYA